MAERTLGELLEQMPKNEGRAASGPRGTQTVPRNSQDPPTLTEIGISKKQSSRVPGYAGGVFVRPEPFHALTAT